MKNNTGRGRHLLAAAAALSLLLSHAPRAQAQGWMAHPAPLRETRAAWLATIGGIDWPRTKATNAQAALRQQRELTDMLDQLKQAGINTVILQTRIRGTLIYPSSIEPLDECLTGTPAKDPGYDPLAFAIDECHQRGMELHAWLVCIPIGTAAKQRALGKQAITQRQPQLCKRAKRELFMRPDHPGTAHHIAQICLEMARNYDIDGISLDYIRYPETTYAYDDDLTPQQRLQAINRIVKTVHDSIKPHFPWVKLSSSPLGRYASTKRYNANGWECLGAVHQDPREWLHQGWQDMLFPMMYYKGDYFYPFLFDWCEHAEGHPVCPGLAICFLDPKEGNWRLDDIRAQIHTARAAGTGGVALYRARYLLENHQGLLQAVSQELFPTPALTPTMDWQHADTTAPLPPTHVQCRRGTLHWQPSSPQATGERSYIFHNVYASDQWPVDTSNPANLIATRVMGDSLTLRGHATATSCFAVTASDRFGNESAPTQSTPPNNERRATPLDTYLLPYTCDPRARP